MPNPNTLPTQALDRLPQAALDHIPPDLLSDTSTAVATLKTLPTQALDRLPQAALDHIPPDLLSSFDFEQLKNINRHDDDLHSAPNHVELNSNPYAAFEMIETDHHSADSSWHLARDDFGFDLT